MTPPDPEQIKKMLGMVGGILMIVFTFGFVFGFILAVAIFG